jgi:hypothetical protein
MNELRKGLDERGVRHMDFTKCGTGRSYPKYEPDRTHWSAHGGAFKFTSQEVDGILYVKTSGSNKWVEMTPEQAIAATVGERNPDGLPSGLTISNDGNLLNWMGENYMRQDAATVGVDTCKCVDVTPNDWDEDLTMYHMECGFTMLHGEDKPRFCGGCGRRIKVSE